MYCATSAYAQWTTMVQNAMAELNTTIQNHANFFSSSESAMSVQRTYQSYGVMSEVVCPLVTMTGMSV